MIFAAASRSPIQFGSYLLTECVGQGGMAVVYKATRSGPNGFQKTVVVKAMLPALTAQREFVAMFSAEARLMAQLTHPNIVQVHDFGVVDGVPYLVMEYLPGRNLSQLRTAVEASGRRVPVGAALAIAREVCHGLGYAHDFIDGEGRRRQIIHRDVSPSNVMVCRDGSVKLLDFGVAKIVGEFDYDVTQSFKGKYAYMSPEQVNHQPIDRRVDVFATGVVLHELLTGKRLFAAGSELETLQRVAAAKVVAPSVDNREVPRALDLIVKKALARDPSERYMSGAQMADALDSLESLIWPRRRLAAWMRELFARDWTLVCEVCGKSVLAGGVCGECGTQAPESDDPSVVSAVKDAQAALQPIFSGGQTERNVVAPEELALGDATDPLPLPPLPMSPSKRARLSVVRTPLPPPLAPAGTAPPPARRVARPLESDEIEAADAEPPKLFVVPAPSSGPKRVALSARMHAPVEELAAEELAAEELAAEELAAEELPTLAQLPPRETPAPRASGSAPRASGSAGARAEWPAVISTVGRAPLPATAERAAPTPPMTMPATPPRAPLASASWNRPTLAAWPAAMRPTAESLGFPPAVPPRSAAAVSTAELPRVQPRGRFAIVTLLLAAAITGVAAWTLYLQPKPAVSELPAAVVVEVPVLPGPAAPSAAATVATGADKNATAAASATSAPKDATAPADASLAARASAKPVRRHPPTAPKPRVAADRTVSEGRIVDPFAGGR